MKQLGIYNCVVRYMLIVVFALSSCSAIAISNANITLHPAEEAVRVDGLNQEQIGALAQLTELEMRSALSVVISDTFPSEADFVIYVVGKVDFSSDHISFVPAQPLNPNQEYYLSLSLLPIGEKLMIEEKFTLATLLSGDEPSIVHVLPGPTQLPANLTHFEVIFSEPMDREQPLGAIRILDAKQQPLYLLNALTQTQWSDDGKRLVIKLPNQPNSQLPQSNNSDRFTVRLLSLSGALKSQKGEPMRRDVEKPFYLQPIDTQPPQPKSWVLYIPKQGTLEGFEIHFDEPLDLASLKNGIEVFNAEGKRVAGKVLVSHPQHSWHFIPRDAWGEGEYRVVVTQGLSDLAGNALESDVELEFVAE